MIEQPSMLWLSNQASLKGYLKLFLVGGENALKSESVDYQYVAKSV